MEQGGAGIAAGSTSHWSRVWGSLLWGRRAVHGWDTQLGLCGVCRAVPQSVQWEVSGERLRWLGCGRNAVWRKLNPGEKTL